MAQGFMLHRRRKVVSKAFKTTWNVAVGTLTIPSQVGNYNCTVDWGDGTAPTRHTTGSLVHEYTTAGLCQISITGQYNGFWINYKPETRARLISVDAWGTVRFTSMRGTFEGCSNLASIPSGSITGAENATDFAFCFNYCSSLTSIPSGLFDNVPNATDFSFCFYNCTSLISIPSGLFDNVPNVTDFSSCFRSCSSLMSIPSGLFDNVPNVTDFSVCFHDCPLHLPLTMFNYTALTGKQPRMQNSFGGSVSKTGTAYPLWDYITITSRNSCYRDQTALTNYASIPSNWK